MVGAAGSGGDRVTTILHALFYGFVGFAVAYGVQEAIRHIRNSKEGRQQRERDYRERSSWYDWR